MALVTYRGIPFDSVHPWYLAWLEAPSPRIRLARIQAGLMSKLGSLSEDRTFRLARNITGGYCLTRCSSGTSLGSRYHLSEFAWLEFKLVSCQSLALCLRPEHSAWLGIFISQNLRGSNSCGTQLKAWLFVWEQSVPLGSEYCRSSCLA